MFTAILRRRCRDFLYILWPHTFSTITNILHHSGTLVIIGEPKLTDYNQPKSIVCLRVHAWCCIVYRFGHKPICVQIMCPNCIQSIIVSHRVVLCPENPLCFTYGIYFQYFPNFLLFIFFMSCLVSSCLVP